MELDKIATDRGDRLVKWTGAGFVIMGILNLFFSILSPIRELDFLGLLINISIGAGMFEKRAWSRTLGIVVCVLITLESILLAFLYFFPNPAIGYVSSNFAPGLTLLLLMVTLIFYPLVLYIFFQSDVKALFKSK
jgi:hypothetical protein